MDGGVVQRSRPLAWVRPGRGNHRTIPAGQAAVSNQRPARTPACPVSPLAPRLRLGSALHGRLEEISAFGLGEFGLLKVLSVPERLCAQQEGDDEGICVRSRARLIECLRAWHRNRRPARRNRSRAASVRLSPPFRSRTRTFGSPPEAGRSASTGSTPAPASARPTANLKRAERPAAITAVRASGCRPHWQ